MIILRLGEHHKNEIEANKLIDAIKRNPGCCDEVWFSSAYGYPKMETHQKNAADMRNAVNLFHRAGVKVSLQISNTLGHGAYIMNSYDCSGLLYEGSPVGHMTGSDGTRADCCFCWNDPVFNKYIIETVRIYAENVQAKDIWFDDDLRANNHAPVGYGCFCETCVAAFNKQNASNYSREEIVFKMNYGDINLREAYINYIREGMGRFTESLVQAAIEVSPDSRFGYQWGRFLNYTGTTYNHILDAMKSVSGKNPLTRPGGGFYNDKTPQEAINKALTIHNANSVLPNNIIEKYAEIENIPDVAFGKSIDGTCKESSLYLAYGCNGLTYATLMTAYEPIEWHEVMLKRFCVYRPYWERLIVYNGKSHVSGACIFESKYAHLRELSQNEPEFNWCTIHSWGGIVLSKIGLPVTCERDYSQLYVLQRDAVAHMTDDDIEFLLCKPVLTDAGAVKAIMERGFAARFGAKISEIDCSAAHEEFTDHSVNDNAQVREWERCFFSDNLESGCLIKGGTSIGDLVHNITGERLGCTNALIDIYNASGQKSVDWAVFGYSLWGDIISFSKSRQIIYAADFVCGHTLPAIAESPEQLLVIPRIDNEGKTVCVSVQSITIGETGELAFIIRNPKGECFTFMSAKCAEFEIPYKKCGDNYVLHIPGLEPWEMGTIFVT
jgi:hypothetical protein